MKPETEKHLRMTAEGIVIFGGTFNPIHSGHLELCRCAFETARPRVIVLVPTIPFYKFGQYIAPAEDRL